jgi:hypothetical protein
MNKPALPKQDDLARLAAIVFPACTSKVLPPDDRDKISSSKEVSREEESVRVAARLWLHAGEYCEWLCAAINASDHSTKWTQPWSIAGDLSKARQEQRMAEFFDPSKTALTIDCALEWVKKNAPAKKDRSLSRDTLSEALGEFDGFKGPRLEYPIQLLRDFLAWRTRQRSAARGARRSAQQDKSRKKKR